MSTPTVAECWRAYWLGHVQHRHASPATADFIWRVLEPYFGALRAPQIDQRAVDRYVSLRGAGALGRPAQPQTCRKELGLLLAALRFCAARPQSMFPSALIEPLRLPDAAEPRDRWLRTEEIQRLLDAAAGRRQGGSLSRVERFVWIALETAARQQAILDLTWDRVYFDTDVIHFDTPGRRRTNKRRAAVAMSRNLRPVLERAFLERENDLVLEHSTPLWGALQTVAADAGFGGEGRRTGISPHVFRHTAATHMARRGVPLFDIARVLGDSVQTVERVYAKWAPDDPARTVDLISAGELRTAV